MIKRYCLPEMTGLWTDEAKYKSWLAVELAVCEAHCQLGNIPKDALATIKEKAKFDPDKIAAIENEVKHDVIAFLTNVGQDVGEASRFIHLGLTSSDVVDTALGLTLKRAGEILTLDLKRLHDVILNQAKKHKHTLQVGRSHGIHAEPLTFGFKLAVWLEEVRRHQRRLATAVQNVAVGKISGAVGTYSNISPKVEIIACGILGLTPEKASTQIIQRDRHAEFICTLAQIGSSLEKFATEIRHLQRTDVLEVEEPFSQGQKGSSAMPHKRNPVGCENISGLARILRGHAVAALENVALWHERDISHSSVERIIMPDSTILLDYMLNRFSTILNDLIVHPENMLRNLDVYGGVIYSQAVLLKLIEKGLTREAAYKHVQQNAMTAWNKEDGDFKMNLINDKEVRKHLSQKEIEECFLAENYLKNIDAIFKRLDI